MADFPEIGYGTVQGRFLAGVLDSEDPAEAPDAEPLSGFVTFAATAPAVKVVGAQPVPTTLFPQSVRVYLDSEGYLSVDGSRDISLWATDDQDGNPYDWQWHVTFSLNHDGHGIYYAPFNFALPTGSVVDLTVVAPLASPSPGTIIIQGPQGEKGEQGEPGQGIKIAGSLPNPGPPPAPGAEDGEFWIDSNGDGWVWSADSASWINTGQVQGPEGPQGPQGIQGVQGVPGTPGAPGADSTVPGPPGAKGDPGEPGADSTVPGPEGPQGPQGEKGDPGEPGSGGGLKVYTTLAEVEAVRVTEMGTLYVPDLALAFPNLAAVGSGVENIFLAGKDATLVIETTEFASGAGADWVTIGQTFEMFSNVAFQSRKVTIRRIATFGTAVPSYLVGLWVVHPELPVTSAIDSVPVFASGGKWNARSSTSGPNASTLMARDSGGKSQVEAPTQPKDIVNKTYADSKAGSIILTGHGVPAENIGATGNFYIDIDTGTMYGPKRPDLYQAEPFLLSGPPESQLVAGASGRVNGVRFTVNIAGRLKYVRLYQYTAPIGNGISIAVWDAAGTKIAFGSGTISVVNDYTTVMLANGVYPTLTPGVEYRLSYVSYSGNNYNYTAAGGFPKAGEHVTLLTAVKDETSTTAVPTVDDPGNFYIEPVFELPVATLWPVAIPGTGATFDAAIKQYVDDAIAAAIAALP